MSDRYKGGILSGTAPTVTPQSANGVYTASQQYQYQGQGVWPTAAQNPILQSLRFRSSASAYLNRTPASAGNRRTWTWSGWVKIGKDATTPQYIFVGNSAATDAGFLGLGFTNAATNFVVTGWATNWRITTQAFRDPAAWYHIVAVLDTTQATANDRVKVYVNGVQVTAFNTTNNPTQNSDLGVNTAATHYLSTYNGTNEPFDGYLAEVNFIDGQALTPSSFGTTDVNGIWQPTPYTGTYGTNGFYLPFSDKSALTTSSNVGLGKDFSGNGNYWATNNISITAGSTYDSMLDSPSNANPSIGNYCVLNPLDKLSAVTTPSNGNLRYTTANTFGLLRGTFGATSGKWYYETTITAVPSGGSMYIGVKDSNNTSMDSSNGLGSNSGITNEFGYAQSGFSQNNNSATNIGTTLGAGDILMVAYDLNVGCIWWGKNGTWISSGNPATGANPMFSTLTSSNGYSPSIGYNSSYTDGIASFNFGQQPFAYTPPTGFNRLNTYNLPVPTIPAGNKQMDVVLRIGGAPSGGTYATTLDLTQGGLLWDKGRSTVSSNNLIDSVRGLSKFLISNSTSAEGTDVNFITTFNNGSFQTGTSDYASSVSLVDWIWKAGGAAVTNTSGTISSQVSANTTSGFSIVTWTGTGSAATVGHGLGVAPSMIIAKSRSTVANWQVYHSSISNMATGFIMINSTAAFSTATSQIWNSTAPTSTVFSLGTDTDINGSANTIVAYCFAQITGYSAFGIYTGNGSADGPFVYLGFRPRFVMIKRTDGIGNWSIYDTSRDPYNVMTQVIFGNLSDAESNNTATVDYLSNGFKLRIATFQPNTSGATFIYMAFAENPFKMARAR
jgi:hypothetical protein